MEYLFLFFAVLCIGGQFTVQKLYQTREKTGRLVGALVFSCLSSGMAAIAFLFLCQFQITFRWFSFLMAAGGMTCVVLYTVLGIKMMSVGKVAVYTMIIMLGGMLLPFLYGILFLNEELSWEKIIGILVIFVALILSITGGKEEEKSKKTWLFSLLGVVVFLANGMVGVFNKAHQISSKAISTYAFGFWQNVFAFFLLLIVLVVCFFCQKDKAPIEKSVKSALSYWWIIFFFMLVSQTGSIFQLLAAKEVEASVMFPIVTGGTIVTSGLFGFVFFKEKIDKRLACSLVLALVATVLIAI